MCDIKLEVNLNYWDLYSPQDGLTPLHCAARNGHVRTVALLLERRAAVTARTSRGLTALHLAVQGDHIDAAKLLMQIGQAPVDDATSVS